MALPERRLRTLHLFAGAGGGILADILLGHVPVCAVEIDPDARRVLLARQRDGLLPKFPIWDDVTTFDGYGWRGEIDILSGGFPCQDISAAGSGAGIDGSRSGLWREFARLICEIGPRYVFVENSPVLTSRGIDRVLGDLAAMGYNAEWGVLGAGEMGAPHERYRIWIAAYSKSIEVFQLPKTPEPSNAASFGQSRPWKYDASECAKAGPFREAVGLVNALREGAMPFVCRGHDGLADGLDRVRILGNGQVPIVAATAWRVLS